MIAAIQKQRGGQPARFEPLQLLESLPIDLCHTRLPVGRKRAVLLPHPRQCCPHCVEVPFRHFRVHPFIIISFDQIHRPLASQIPVVQLARMFRARPILAVQPPVARHDVQTTVSVKITHVHSVPPSGELADCRLLIVDCHLSVPQHEIAAVVAEDFERSPFAGQNQFRIAVPIQITEDRSAHQSNSRQRPRLLPVQFPAARPTPKQK